MKKLIVLLSNEKVKIGHICKVLKNDIVLNGYKIIATTNPLLNLPLISNIKECLDLIGKEVENVFHLTL